MSVAESSYFIGVDVGTGSARAALVTAAGRVLHTHTSPTRTWTPLPDHYEQSSADVWRAVCECVRAVCAAAAAADGIAPELIAGIGFDATCSLVALDAADNATTVSTTGSDEQNIILWMDHRAAAQAQQINRTGHRILRHVGGAVSLEMQTPKLLWCRQQLPAARFARVAHWFDLPDWLTFRATGDRSRSLCSLVCKWNYDAGGRRWPADFFEACGLAELLADGARAIGTHVVAPGSPLAGGLSAAAARELGLLAGTPVGGSMIDAHAGALALLGGHRAGVGSARIDTKLALIAGTSSCHMSVLDGDADGLFVPGVWGPYGGAVFAGMQLHEAGQSATGVLLEHVVRTHPAYAELQRLMAAAGAANEHSHRFLNGLLAQMAEMRACGVAELTADLHVVPDLHGNRSPLADARARGAISGLSMAADVEELARVYLAFVQALAYGTRHIIDTMLAAGRRPAFETLHLGGGLARNALFVRTHADVCGMPVLLADERNGDVMLVGAAMLGARAAGAFRTLQLATQSMAGAGAALVVVEPDADAGAYHDRKYAVFRRMLDDQRAYRNMMEE